MVKLYVMKLGFRTNLNNSLCLDYVWDVTILELFWMDFMICFLNKISIERGIE